ncbi:hypothetical protein GCM10020366_10300 [Saccharopolyspora gregorii]|uniref:Exonuclease VII large subunit C-terminal domain-containing protein n=1 Tax=Saccharopolyspora gregorii TaxID=33914 RepID=A0ABP6RII8_9PSEU
MDRERRLGFAAQQAALADTHGPLDRRSEQVQVGRDRARRAITGVLTAEGHAMTATRSRLTTLGLAATLARGYAIVQRVEPDGADGVLRSIDQAPAGTTLRVRVVDGAVHAVVPGGTE